MCPLYPNNIDGRHRVTLKSRSKSVTATKGQYDQPPVEMEPSSLPRQLTTVVECALNYDFLPKNTATCNKQQT